LELTSEILLTNQMDHLGLASERLLSNQTDPWNQPLKYYCQSNKPAGMALSKILLINQMNTWD
jgi:hypothetical protein